MNEEKMKKDLALDFLIYSYFGIVPKSIYNKIQGGNSTKEEYRDYCIKMVIIKAYDDATGQGAYNTLFSKNIPEGDLSNLKKSSNTAKEKSANYIFKEIKEFDSSVNYDEWHNTVCGKLVENYEAVKHQKTGFFTYGNAQKWINMTVKYLWLLGWLPDGVSEKDLHVPVDSYIIDALWEYENVDLPLVKGNRKGSYSQPSDYVKPWSKWNYEDEYKKCHDSLKKSDFNISEENTAWITQAEIRKKKEKENKYNSFYGSSSSSAENNSKE